MIKLPTYIDSNVNGYSQVINRMYSGMFTDRLQGSWAVPESKWLTLPISL
jgi:hypothetical protein